jgi:hypothetical protein
LDDKRGARKDHGSATLVQKKFELSNFKAFASGKWHLPLANARIHTSKNRHLLENLFFASGISAMICQWQKKRTKRTHPLYWARQTQPKTRKKAEKTWSCRHAITLDDGSLDLIDESL